MVDKDSTSPSAIIGRLVRLETRMINGLSQLGADPCTKLRAGDITVDVEARTIIVSHTSLTVGAILAKLDKVSAPYGVYTLLYGGTRKLRFNYGDE